MTPCVAGRGLMATLALSLAHADCTVVGGPAAACDTLVALGMFIFRMYELLARLIYE